MLKDALKNDGNFPAYPEDSMEYIILDNAMSGYIEMLLQFLDSGVLSYGGSFPFVLLHHGARNKTRFADSTGRICRLNRKNNLCFHVNICIYLRHRERLSPRVKNSSRECMLCRIR